MNAPRQVSPDITAILAPTAPRSRVLRLSLWIALVVALGAGLTWWISARRAAQATTDSAYTTETAARGSLDVKVSATGNLQPTNTVEVGSELSGLVESVFVDDNETVRKGQELARLDTSKLRDEITRSEAALASVEAARAQAMATVKEATANLARLQEVSRLSGGRVPSKTEMETGEATLARAQAAEASAAAAVTESRATLSSNRTNLAKASIRSPINGVVLKRSVEPGQTVAASLQVATLFTIAEDLRRMELEVDVDEADVGGVEDGQLATFSVDAYPSRTYDARVTRVAFGSTTTADVVSYATVLVVDNDDQSLRPGMTASAEISTAAVKDVLLVPNAALRFTPPTTVSRSQGFSLMPRPPQRAPRQTEAMPEDGSRTVWVLRNDVAMQVSVTVGHSDGRHTEITGGGVHEGDRVITDVAAGGQS